MSPLVNSSLTGHPSSGTYVSLTGPGETVTPGDLTQEGGFFVNDVDGHGITLISGTNAAILELASGGNAVLYGDDDTYIGQDSGGTHGSNFTKVTAFLGLDIVSSEIRVGTSSLGSIGFFGHAAVTQPGAPTTLTDVINALTSLGLVA